MSIDLEKLKAAANNFANSPRYRCMMTMDESLVIDALPALISEVERLRHERDRLGHQRGRLMPTIRRLNGEVERLRAALDKIARAGRQACPSKTLVQATALPPPSPKLVHGFTAPNSRSTAARARQILRRGKDE